MAGYIGSKAVITSGVSASIDELNLIDGVTATTAELNYNDTGAAVGVVVASKTVTADANKDVASFRNITLTGELDAGSLDISGDADIDGTLETDALSIAGVAVTTTAAELNLIDGGTARGTTAIADGDGVLINDAGTMRQTSVETLATYMGTKGLGPTFTRGVTVPSSPNAGDWWYNTNGNVLYIYDGTDGWLTNVDRNLGTGRFITANTFSLLADSQGVGTIHKIRYEPEAVMAIDKATIASHSSSQDSTGQIQAVSNASRGVVTRTKTTTATYVYVTMLTNGEASSFGNSNAVINEGSGCDHATRGIFASGAAADGSTLTNHMEYITIASVGNGTDFGNLTAARRYFGSQAVANTTRGVFIGGFDTTDVMDYVTIASAGNATDFGNLTAASYGTATVNSIVRGVIFAAYNSARTGIEYITTASTGNATDFGDHLTNSAASKGWCVHNKLYGYYSRSSAASQEKHTIATAANATAFEFTTTTTDTVIQSATIKGWIAASG